MACAQVDFRTWWKWFACEKERRQMKTVWLEWLDILSFQKKCFRIFSILLGWCFRLTTTWRFGWSVLMHADWPYEPKLRLCHETTNVRTCRWILLNTGKGLEIKPSQRFQAVIQENSNLYQLLRSFKRHGLQFFLKLVLTKPYQTRL